MVSETLYVVDELLLDVGAEVDVSVVNRAGKGKILPYEDTELIAHIVEVIVRVNTAAPYSYHIVVCRCTAFQKLSCAFSIAAGKYLVFGDIVCAHYEDFYAVYAEGEFFAVSTVIVRGTQYGNLAQTNVEFLHIHRLITVKKHNLDHIKVLLAIASYLPQQRVSDDTFRRKSFLCNGCGNEDFLAFGGGDAHVKTEIVGICIGKAGVKNKTDSVVEVFLTDIYAFDAS